MARWGIGYVGSARSAAEVATDFEQARAAWAEAGREGSPYLVAVVYFGLGDPEQSRANVWDYTSIFGAEVARFITDSMVAGPGAVRDTVAAFAGIGADELMFSPGEGDLDEVTRLADTVL